MKTYKTMDPNNKFSTMMITTSFSIAYDMQINI